MKLTVEKSITIPRKELQALLQDWVRKTFGNDNCGGVWYDRNLWGIRVYMNRIAGPQEKAIYDKVLEKYPPKTQQEELDKYWRTDSGYTYDIPKWLSNRILADLLRPENPDIESITSAHPAYNDFIFTFDSNKDKEPEPPVPPTIEHVLKLNFVHLMPETVETIRSDGAQQKARITNIICDTSKEHILLIGNIKRALKDPIWKTDMRNAIWLAIENKYSAIEFSRSAPITTELTRYDKRSDS